MPPGASGRCEKLANQIQQPVAAGHPPAAILKLGTIRDRNCLRLERIQSLPVKETNQRYAEPTRRDWIIGIATLVLFLALIGVGALFLIPDHWLWWLLLVLGGISLLTLNHTRNYAARCRSCGHQFEISFFTGLFSPHGIDKEGPWLRVKCPECRNKAKASVIRIVKDPST